MGCQRYSPQDKQAIVNEALATMMVLRDLKGIGETVRVEPSRGNLTVAPHTIGQYIEYKARWNKGNQDKWKKYIQDMP